MMAATLNRLPLALFYRLRIVGLILALLVVLVGAEGRWIVAQASAADPASDQPATTSAAADGAPLIAAEVRRVNTRANTLSVRHGDIPHLDMPPMTMTFRVQDPALLTGLQVGDEILITVDRIDGAYTVMSVAPVP